MKLFLFRLVFVGLLCGFVLAILIGIETFAYLHLKEQGRNLPFGYMKTKLPELDPAQAWDSEGALSFYDPLLAFSQNPKFLTRKDFVDGFVRYRKNSDSNNRNLKIVVLGGSTTTALASFNWGEELTKLLFENGVNVELYNGGVAGYSSNQELLKLLRDGVNLNPDAIISLHGVNDLGHIHAIQKHPLHHPYHLKVGTYLVNNQTSTSPVLPNSVVLLRDILGIGSSSNGYTQGMSFGMVRVEPDFETWHRNVRMMHAISTEFGIKYFSILQPILGFGDFVPSELEQEMLRQVETRDNGSYKRDLVSFYKEASRIVAGCDYCFDFTNVFVDESDVYRDPRHQTLKGTKIIAKNVYKRVLNGGALLH